MVSVIMSDVFRGVVMPRASARTLRLAPLVADAMLRLVLLLASRHSPDRRHDLLGALGPILLVLNATIWFFSLILGFALAMHALPHGFDPPVGLLDALYASASSFLTLGVSGHEAHGVWARALVIGSALCGFGLVPLVVTFLLNIQGALMQREQLVLRIGERNRKPPTGPAILEQYARLGRDREAALARFFEDWDRWSAHVLLTHRAYPALAYFRSTDHECDWLAALSAVMDAAALLSNLEGDTAAGPAILCHRMGSRLAQDLANTFRCRIDEIPDLERTHFDRVQARLRRAGFDNAGSGAAAFEAFNRMRAEHEPAISGLCRRFGVERAWILSTPDDMIFPSGPGHVSMRAGGNQP